MKVVWSATALDDRRAIFRYLREHNPAAAMKVNGALLLAAESLHRFPERGRPGPVEGTRELPAVHPYLLIYEVDPARQVVRVLRVWHTSRERNP